ncbi:MAG TPA: MtrAB system histidine kinase MtrB [Candidatus Nanopelagicales bacterium]
MPAKPAGLHRRLGERWRHSLRFRVVLTTVVGSTVVILVLVPVLLGRITAGILGTKEASALAEATAARSEAQRLLDASSAQGSPAPASRRIDAVVAAMGARGAQAGLFEVLMLSSEPRGLSATPERGSNLVSERSVPARMREIVAGSQRQAWTYTTIRYTDGREVPGFVVGAPLAVPDVGPYELYQLFPLVQEQETLQLVRNSTVVASAFIILGLALLAAAVTYWLVTPVHDAARTARRFSAGNLDARMRVRGEDDLAQLAVSFNEMAGTLQAQIRDMEQMSKVQQRFVADVSHELRTPLTTVRMAADLLHEKRGELPPDDARAVELLQNQLNRFEALLADLLETSRQDSGAVQMDYEEVDLRALAEGVAGSLAPLAEQTGSAVTVSGDERVQVVCDAMRVERILGNLLANALEHGEGRPVLVQVRRDARGAELAVTDHGIGLSEEQLASVFTRFWRADPSRVRRIGGTGLGLSIALGDARAHGGSLTAAGAPGHGATFTLRLPRAPRGSGVLPGAVG